MTTIVKTIAKNNNTTVYVPNQFIPFLCVFIISKTPTILLVGFVLGYIMVVQPTKKKPSTITSSRSSNAIRMIEAPPLPLPLPQPPIIEEIIDDSYYSYSSSEEDDEEEQQECSRHIKLSSSIIEDNNSSIDFENLMKFPSCPTTLPRLDTHFNFVIDHDIQSPDPSKIDWSAIHQELEYDQQRHQIEEKKEEEAKVVKKDEGNKIESQHPLLLLHQLQQDNLSMMFTKDEISSLPDKRLNNDAAILFIDNEPDVIHIEDILLLPQPKPSLSSPGQLFKSKFQKAVKKMKKSTKQQYDNSHSKRSSMFSDTSSNRTESLPAPSYQHSSLSYQESSSPFLNSALSPRPSASARVHDHLKCRLNKLFKK